MDITSFAVRFTTQGNRRPMSQSFTQNSTVTFPAGVTSVDMNGYGARGQAGSTIRVRQYKRDVSYYGTRRSDGVTVVDRTVYGQQASGPLPATSSYCDPPAPTGSQSEYSSTTTCYSNFVDNSYNYTQPPTTGTSATGLSRTFPGSTGDVAQTTTGFSGVAVTAGTSYNLVIPAGGLITINYYA